MSAFLSSPGRPITVEHWMKVIGKRNLQGFQDCFAAETGIALQLVGRAGDPLLTPSRHKWFCEFSKTHFGHTCSAESPQVIKGLIQRYDLRRDYDPTFVSCDFGLSAFFVPVYYDDRLIAFWSGGGVVLEDQHRAELLMCKFDVVQMTEEELKRSIRRLVVTTRLLNAHPDGSVVEPEISRGDVLFEGKLTRREGEVADLVCRGMSNREVAQKLYISEKTVKSHMSKVLSKLAVRDRSQLVFEFGNRHTSAATR